MTDLGPKLTVPEGFTGLSGQSYRLALKFAEESKAESFAPVTALPIAAVIHAVVALESFLNEELEKMSKTGSAERAAVVDLLREKQELLMRWRLSSLLLAGKQIDAGSEPFQSFTFLVQLRNELVHYSPKTAPWGAVPRPKLIDALRSRFAFRDSPRSDWCHQVLSPGCAEWACKTAEAMGRQFVTDFQMPWRLEVEWTDDGKPHIGEPPPHCP